MKTIRYNIKSRLTALVISGAMLGSGIATAQPDGGSEGAEVLTRGPVHEAFAGTVTYDPVAGVIIDQSPPAMIEEIPPDQRPAGDNIAWIPGYWAWDEDQNDFLWISGIWRNLPPGREWVPGYWAETGNRHQWTSGYWENAENTEVSYLPEPPRSVETGPNIKAASNDQSWIPGNWVYRNDNYAWRAGYWVTARDNWSWTPAYYRWTHRGYVYVDGYWDYPVVRRGVVFAPVHFDREYVSRPDFYYTPLTVIALSVFTNHLFLRPTHGHYYFGDYYEPAYRDRGFFASYSYNSGRRGYDPIYAHNRWENRNDSNWDRQRQDYFEYRRDHSDARPPRTWAALNSRSQNERNRGDFGVADRYDRVVKNGGEGRQRFQAVNEQERGRIVSQKQEIRKFGKERQQLETAGKRPEGNQASREKINRSPLVARSSNSSDKNGGPPARLHDRTQEEDKSGKAKNGSQDERKEANTRNEEPSSKQKSNVPEETRTKPGQKREVDPTPREKEKSSNNSKNRDDNKPKAKTETTRKVDPTPEPKAKPEPQRKAEPQPEPRRKMESQPEPKRKVEPQPEPRVKKPESKPEPRPEPKVKKPEEKRESSAMPARKANPQTAARPDSRKPEARPQPQQQPQTAARQPSKTGKGNPSQGADGGKSQNREPAATPELTEKQKAERRKKKQEAE